MSKFRIKNFGPIKEGLSENDGFIEISPVTVICGDQAMGKSTIAKLYASFLWLEKRITGGLLPIHLDKDYFVGTLLKHYRIDTYIQKNTVIDFIGTALQFSFQDGNFSISKVKDSAYIRPKILYVPADRGFCMSVQNPTTIKGLASNTFDFLSDLLDAEVALNGKKYALPLNGYSFRYDTALNKAYISDETKPYEIEMADASSGLQTLSPLILTSDYYSRLFDANKAENFQPFSVDQEKKWKDGLEKIGKQYGSPDSGLEFLSDVIKKFEEMLNGKVNAKNDRDIKIITYLRTIINSRFVNIVEEPEQNLYPDSQSVVLYSLLEYMNTNTSNQLLITTHSPYILGVLNNCIYAGNLTNVGKDCSAVIPPNHQIPVEKVSAYKIEDGKIRSIISSDLHLINNGEIDGCSERINADFQKLEDIEFA